MEASIRLFKAFSRNRQGELRFDNTNTVARLLYRRKYYVRCAAIALRKIPLRDMLRSHFSFQLRDSERPAYLTVEFTNYCNLRCPYCTSPLELRAKGMMSDELFDKLLTQIVELRIPRVRVVGNGESTLHPHFAGMILRLGHVVPFVQLVTNGQRLKPEVIEAILTAPVALLEISADSNEKAGYEAMRIGGSFERLIETLQTIKDMKKELRSKTLVNVRAMIRPSNRKQEDDVLRFWRQYADTAMPQYIVDITRLHNVDTFVQIQDGAIPRCPIPLKTMNVLWNGNVQMCGLSTVQLGTPEGLILGNIADTTLRELWTCETIRQYREGHRKCANELTPMCRGCVGG